MKYKIINYSKECENQVKRFLMSVAIDEFGFTAWRDYLLNKDFTPYETGSSLFLIVKDEYGNIIGSCGGLKVNEDTIKLNSFYITKQFRSQKIGSNLYDRIEMFARENNFKKIILCTYARFDIANIFYQKRGFHLKEKIDDELWQEKRL